MNIRIPLIVSATIIVAMAGLSLWAGTMLPPGSQIAIHFGVNGEANGFARPLVGLSLLPLTAVGLSALLAIIPRIEPRRTNLASSATAYAVTWIAVMVLLAVIHGIVVYYAVAGTHGVAMPNVGRVIAFFVGALFVALGSQLHQVRSNFMFGLRTPWTLADDRVWQGTHQLGRWVCMAAGLVLILAALLVHTQALLAQLVLVITLAMVGTLVIASYVLWRMRDNLSGHSS